MVLVLSSLVALIAWQWLLDGLHGLRQATEGGVSTASVVAVARWLLPAFRYHVYYRIDEAKRIVYVRAFWHASRGRSPALR